MSAFIKVIVAIAVSIIVFFMPLFVALAFRFFFRGFNARLLAGLIATPFTVLLVSRLDILSDFHSDKCDHEIGLIITILRFLTDLIVFFCIPYLMAIGGIRIGDRIRKKSKGSEYQHESRGARDRSGH